MSLSDKKSTECFFKGFTSVLDLSPKIDLPERFKYEPSNSWLLVDANALSDDWKKIGNDLENAMRKYDKSTEKKQRTLSSDGP